MAESCGSDVGGMDVAARGGVASKGSAADGAELEGCVLGCKELALVLRGLLITSMNPSSQDCRLVAVITGTRLDEQLPGTVSVPHPVREKPRK